jgi:hypothetical protein
MASIEAILTALRKRFRFVEGQVPHDEMDMLHEAGKAPEALLYSLLFVPRLSIVADSVLLTYIYGVDDTERHFLEGKREGRMSLERLEASFNRVEVPFLFFDRNADDDEDRLLAERIAEAWRGALAVFCPDRRFVVNVVPPEENGDIIAVEFFERRSAE